MSKDEIKIKKIKDESDNFKIEVSNAPNIPFKLGILGPSMISGKTNLMINLVGQRKLYGKYFKGDNIYLISPSLETPKLKKFAEYKKIPDVNLFNEFNDEELGALYDYLKEDFLEGNTKPKLIIFDDCGFDTKTGAKSNLDHLIIDGRHYNISLMFLVQCYTMMSTTFRRNATGLMCFSCVTNDLESIISEHNTTTDDKKKFMKTFRDVTNKKHNFFTIDKSKQPTKGRYRNNVNDIIIID